MNEQHVSPSPSIAIVGAGPRGTSLLERLGANLSADPVPDLALTVHVIDDAPSGPGRIWRTDQPRDLCMNTLADAVTLFTEPCATIVGPVREGPTLYEWGVLVRSGSLGPAHSHAAAAIPAARAAAFAAHPVRAGLADDYAAELAVLLPESHPSRAFYGEYLAWCFDRALALLPDGVRVTRHRARAVGVERVTRIGGGFGSTGFGSECFGDEGSYRERLTLDDGSSIFADAVVLATGWLPSAESPAERTLARQIAAARASATWVRPASPIEQDLQAIAPGSSVIMRGLGMSFFDTLSLLTLGRGGEFVPDTVAPGGLRYVASGQEPVVYATSRRGVPFRSKSLYGGLPPRSAQRLLRAVDWAREPRPINFDRRLWPRIVGDAFVAHAETLARVQSGSVSRADDIEPAITKAITALEATPATGTLGLLETVDRIAATIAPFIPNPADRFDLRGEVDPARGQFASPEAFDAWVLERVAADLQQAKLGADSPVKAGLWSLSAARAVASRIGTLGGFDAESRASGFKLLFEIGGMVGSGPPAFRNRQLLALAAAGLVRFIGPGATVDAEAGSGFVAQSPRVPGSRITADVLIDAWMHFHSLDATADPLASALLRAGRARSFRVPARAIPGSVNSPGGTVGPENVAGQEDSAAPTISTGGFDVDPESGRLVQVNGGLDPAVHVAGIPADQALHDTVISPMPGTDPPMLRETDRVARSAIRIALRSHRTPPMSLATVSEGALRVS